MADDNDDWFAGGDDDLPAEEPMTLLQKKQSLESEAAAAAAAAQVTASADAGAAAAGDVAPMDEELEFLDPDKLLLCKHWIRPRFLQYKYLFDYRHNYYDDVIDFLDKRQRGYSREIPRPQTWAERALRTYSSKMNRNEFYRSLDEDRKLASKMKLTGAFYHYHTREYFNRKYASIL